MILLGDCRAILLTLDAGSVRCCVTSPPYWGLRDYGCEGQLGLEKTPEEYVAAMVGVFHDVLRVLADDGTAWINLGDSYAGGGHGGGGSYESERAWRKGNPEKNGGVSSRDGLGRVTGLKPKDLVGIPWRVAFALQADGWYLRSDIIWHKPNPMPESVTDRPTKSHEYVFLLSKSARYYYDLEAIREPVSPNWEYAAGAPMPKLGPHIPHEGRTRQAKRIYQVPKGANARTVWTIPTQPTPDAHFATFPEALAERCVLAGSAQGDTILDPFFGSGTVGKVAERLGRKWVGIELNPAYVGISERKTAQRGMFV